MAGRSWWRPILCIFIGYHRWTATAISGQIDIRIILKSWEEEETRDMMSMWGAVTGNDSAAARVITHSQANVWQMVTQMALAHTIPSSRDWSPSPMIHPSHVCHVCHHTCPQSPCVAWTTTPASHVRPRLASHPTLPCVKTAHTRHKDLVSHEQDDRKTGSYCDSGWLRWVSFLDKVHNLARITIFTRHWDINNE